MFGTRGALSFHSRGRTVRARALRNDESRCVVVAFYRHNYFQRKFVCDGADPAGAGLVGRGHAAWRLVFFSRLGMVGYFAGQVIL